MLRSCATFQSLRRWHPPAPRQSPTALLLLGQCRNSTCLQRALDPALFPPASRSVSQVHPRAGPEPRTGGLHMVKDAGVSIVIREPDPEPTFAASPIVWLYGMTHRRPGRG